jgi:hypothetical protein
MSSPPTAESAGHSRHAHRSHRFFDLGSPGTFTRTPSRLLQRMLNKKAESGLKIARLRRATSLSDFVASH